MFVSVLAALARADVGFIVVGGLAVAQAGYARYTEDIDILVSAAPPNLERLLAVLSGIGEGAAGELKPDDFPLEEGAVRIIEDVVIDVFTQMSGHTYDDLLPLAESHPVDGEKVLFLNVEGLIRLKEGSLRPKDQLDVQALRSIRTEL